MKKILMLFVFSLAFGLIVNGQGLNEFSTYVKENYPDQYTNTIRKHAIEKWNTDHEMIVYEINKQSEAVANLFIGFADENEEIVMDLVLLIDALAKWSLDGYKNQNLTKMESYLKNKSQKNGKNNQSLNL